jgi:hypothetical protein
MVYVLFRYVSIRGVRLADIEPKFHVGLKLASEAETAVAERWFWW